MNNVDGLLELRFRFRIIFSRRLSIAAYSASMSGEDGGNVVTVRDVFVYVKDRGVLSRANVIPILTFRTAVNNLHEHSRHVAGTQYTVRRMAGMRAGKMIGPKAECR